jgi:cardiolipin synthase
VRVVTPYFLPDERLLSALALAAWRGVTVDIVLPEQSNHRLVDWAARAQLRPLLQAGCRIWHQPAPFDHSKLMTVDGAWSLVGSANWDVRSLRLNFELDVEVYCERFAARVDAEIERRRGQRVTTVELDARPFPVVLRDATVRLLLPYL